jgi:type VI secretion system protein
MALRLSILSVPAGGSGAETIKVLESGQLSVGRDESSDWTLPSKVVSRCHCVISGSGKRFRLTDTSKNGVFVDDGDKPVGKDKTIDLCDGQRLRVGDYEIRVGIDSGEGDRREAPGVTVIEEVPEPVRRRTPIETGLPGDDAVGPLAGFDRDEEQRAARLPRQSSLDGDDALGENFEPPQPVPPASSRSDAKSGDRILPDIIPGLAIEEKELIPEPPEIAVKPPLAEKSDEAFPPPQPPTTPEPVPEVAGPIERTPEEARRPKSTTAVPPADGAAAPIDPDALTAFLTGAGLAPGSPNMEDPVRAMRVIGEVLYTVVDSTIRLLDARSQIKKEIGLGQTLFSAQDNNPLKFSKDARQALKLLFDEGQRGYLSPREAFVEAFEDIADHEYALLDGVRDAWTDLLARVDPVSLGQRVGKDKGLAALLSSGKARCWDIYCERYKEILEDADRIFNSKVAAAYEKQGGKRRRRQR